MTSTTCQCPFLQARIGHGRILRNPYRCSNCPPATSFVASQQTTTDLHSFKFCANTTVPKSLYKTIVYKKMRRNGMNEAASYHAGAEGICLKNMLTSIVRYF